MQRFSSLIIFLAISACGENSVAIKKLLLFSNWLFENEGRNARKKKEKNNIKKQVSSCASKHKNLPQTCVTTNTREKKKELRRCAPKPNNYLHQKLSQFTDSANFFSLFFFGPSSPQSPSQTRCNQSNLENPSLLHLVVFVLATPLLVLPFLVVQRAHITCLQPAGDAVEVEGVVARAPRDGTLPCTIRLLVSLTFNAKIHDMVSANRAGIHLDVPRPQRNGVPLFDFKSRLDGAWSGRGDFRSSCVVVVVVVLCFGTHCYKS